MSSSCSDQVIVRLDAITEVASPSPSASAAAETAATSVSEADDNASQASQTSHKSNASSNNANVYNQSNNNAHNTSSLLNTSHLALLNISTTNSSDNLLDASAVTLPASNKSSETNIINTNTNASLLGPILNDSDLLHDDVVTLPTLCSTSSTTTTRQPSDHTSASTMTTTTAASSLTASNNNANNKDGNADDKTNDTTTAAAALLAATTCSNRFGRQRSTESKTNKETFDNEAAATDDAKAPNANDAPMAVPPRTPSPLKKSLKQQDDSLSPTNTAPLSPETNELIDLEARGGDGGDDDDYDRYTNEYGYDGKDDDDKSTAAVVGRPSACRLSRPAFLGATCLVLVALVLMIFLIVSRSNGTSGGSDSSKAIDSNGPAPSPPVEPTSSGGNTGSSNDQGGNNQGTTGNGNSNDQGNNQDSGIVPAPADPTASPIASPTTSPTTAAPTASPTMAAWYDLVQALSDIAPVAVLEDTETLQGQAVAWMINNENPAQLVLGDPVLIRQRFAVTVLDRATVASGQPRVSQALVPTCQWEGVSCVNGTQLVESIAWPGQGLDGYLPTEVAALSASLVTLDLADNALAGPLPDGLFECNRLQNLYLFSNQFTGSLSEDFGRLHMLRRLLLGDNLFSGVLPQAFGSPNPDSTKAMRPLRKFVLDFVGSLFAIL